MCKDVGYRTTEGCNSIYDHVRTTLSRREHILKDLNTSVCYCIIFMPRDVWQCTAYFHERCLNRTLLITASGAWQAIAPL